LFITRYGYDQTLRRRADRCGESGILRVELRVRRAALSVLRGPARVSAIRAGVGEFKQELLAVHA
jgi:hypothetical protein